MPGIFDLLRRVIHRCRRNGSAPEPNLVRRDIVSVSEVNYFGLATLLINQYGHEARAEAVRLTQEAIEEADLEAVADWRAVEQAVGLLADDYGAGSNGTENRH